MSAHAQTQTRRQRRRQAQLRRRALAAVAGIVLVGVASAVGVSKASSSATPSYRTALATIATVKRTLSVSGTLIPVSQATAAFQVAGTVKAVDVRSGERVTAGQTIATLDPSTLTEQEQQAETNLAAAQAKLTEDENDESTSSAAASNSTSTAQAGSGTAATTSRTGTTGTVTNTTLARKPSATSTALAKGQRTVVADQHTVDTDMQATTRDLATIASACATSSSANGTSGSTGASGTSDATGANAAATNTSTASSAASNASASTSSACAEDLRIANTAEIQVSTDQKALATAEKRLASTLASKAGSSSRASGSSGASGASGSTSKTTTASSGSTNASHATGSTGTTGSAGSSASTTPGSASGRSTSVNTDTPAQLASDQSTIDSDEASTVQAKQALHAATLVSPISGTVESVAIATGERVTSGSATDTITIVDQGSYEIDGTLTTTQAQEVKTGEDAQVTVDGITATMTGKVTRVGPVDDSNSSYSYPVIVTITSPTSRMADGASAHAAIELARADDVLVVPTSAVHTAANNDSYLELDERGHEVRRSVTVGLVGATYSQISSGLTKGQTVILADPSKAVPSSSTTTTPGFAGGVGAGAGAGFPRTGAAGGFQPTSAAATG